jgi:hypothetical protein
MPEYGCKMAALALLPFIWKWMHSVLLNWQQHVKIGTVALEEISPNRGLPPGTWFGPHVFLILVNDLKTFLPLLKFIDDIAMSNIIDHKDTTKCSHMQVAADQLAEWSYLNYMNIDGRKTKEMLHGAVKKNTLPLIEFGSISVDHVSWFKLLAIN